MTPSRTPSLYVERCVARQDGTWMIVCKGGQTGVSPVAIREGARVTIVGGKAEQVSR